MDLCKNNHVPHHNKDKWQWIIKIIENNSIPKLNMKTLGLPHKDNILVTENKIWFLIIRHLNSNTLNRSQTIINNLKDNKQLHLVIQINHLVIINHQAKKEQDKDLHNNHNNHNKDSNKLLLNKNSLLHNKNSLLHNKNSQ